MMRGPEVAPIMRGPEVAPMMRRPEVALLYVILVLFVDLLYSVIIIKSMSTYSAQYIPFFLIAALISFNKLLLSSKALISSDIPSQSLTAFLIFLIASVSCSGRYFSSCPLINNS